MVKKRSFWTGIGIGLVAGAVLLQMMMIGASNESSTNETEQLDLNTLRQRAESLGYQLYASDEQWFSEEELQTRIQEAKDEALRQAEPEIITSIEKSIYVLPGMSSNQVADVLLELELIEDKKQFIDEIKKRELQGKIQTGVITFIEEMTLEEIITRITEK